jgi:hypothetical protein
VLGLIVEGEAVGAGLCEWLNVMFGESDHEMAVEVHIGQMLAQTGNYWSSNGKVGHKVTV